ncbi:MAG: DUF29 domain-containing protein [Candidatus Competibacteraceae bacterium]|nr:MAG: DUF29 domain-containing protein [Candidatus Competibacteraceae bacterium]
MKNISIDYENDFHAWTLENAALLRQQRFTEIDVDHIAEELENMGRSERHELTNRFAVLLAHLLKWRFQPERRGNSWRYTIEEQRRRIKRLLDENPSLGSRLEKAFENAYGDAVLIAAREMDCDKNTFPTACSFTQKQAMDSDYWPD